MSANLKQIQKLFCRKIVIFKIYFSIEIGIYSIKLGIFITVFNTKNTIMLIECLLYENVKGNYKSSLDTICNFTSLIRA